MATYHYRRRLTPKENLPPLGAALAVAGGVFYLARLLLQRTPLEVRAAHTSDGVAPRAAPLPPAMPADATRVAPAGRAAAQLRPSRPG
jgi:hypothetical protein